MFWFFLPFYYSITKNEISESMNVLSNDISIELVVDVVSVAVITGSWSILTVIDILLLKNTEKDINGTWHEE